MRSNIRIPVFDEATLAACTPKEMIDILIENEDRVPRKVIDACASRGETMLDALAPLAQPNEELESVNAGYWWLRLHAVMILGLIPGERAGKVLIEFIHGMSQEEDHELQDWLAGYWPALFNNKPESVVASLQNICMDKEIDWYIRTNMMEAVLDRAQQQGETALEQTLDWAVQITADEKEDWEYRLLVANDLLDFPRERHRALLTDLAARQSGWGKNFDENDIDKAYARGKDVPEWAHFSDPWIFYHDSEIKKRQQRWQEEDREYSLDLKTIDAMARESGYPNQQPYQRETRKIGRNDPCPCGSGKKYKKCCMGKG